MNTRRNLLTVLGAAAYAPRILFAQAKKRPVLIGYLNFGSRGPARQLAAFKEGLVALGWNEGTSTVFSRARIRATFRSNYP